MNKFIAFLPRYFVSSMHRISMEPFFVAIHWLTLFFNALNSSIHHSHIHSSLFSSKFIDSEFVFTNDENRCFGVRWTFKKIKKVFCRTLHCGKLKYRNDSETIEMRLVRTCVTLLTSHRVLNPKNMWSKEKNVGLFFLFCSLMLWSTTHTKQQYTNWCVCALCSVVKRFARYYTQQCIVKSERLRERWIEHKKFTIWETYTCTCILWKLHAFESRERNDTKWQYPIGFQSQMRADYIVQRGNTFYFGNVKKLNEE